jgi:hypothetical protein
VKSDDIRILRDIEQYYSTQIDEMPMNGKMQLSDFEKSASSLIPPNTAGLLWVLLFPPVVRNGPYWTSRANCLELLE